MRRTGIRTLRRCCQAGYTPIHLGIEDQVAEDRQESLRCYRHPEEEQLSPLSYVHDSPVALCTEFANWRTSAITDFVNCLNFNSLRLVLNLHSLVYRSARGSMADKRTSGHQRRDPMTKNELNRFREILMANVA